MDDDNEDGWIYPIGHIYQPVIVEFMSFFHGCVEYEPDTVFTREQLLEIRPTDVKRFLCLKAYDDPDPRIENGARPTNGRSDSLYYIKKALSKYMPYRNANWINGQGNPTKSVVVNDMIKQVKKFEVRGEGAESNAKRPLKQAEFRKTIQLFKSEDNDWNHKWRYPMMALWQYHLIGQIDDVVHFKMEDPRGHGDYDFCLKTKVRWSKNVMEERQCPPQILLGAMDPMFCLLLNLAIYLEETLARNPNQLYLFTDATSDRAPKNLIQTYRKRLEKVVWKHQDFKSLATEEDDKEGVGTHSYRKFPANHARGCGCAPDEIEIRGRWKTQGQRVVFRYIDVKQLTIDAKVAGVLCVGGPIKYKLKEDVNLTDDWLFNNVVPKIRSRYPNDSRLCRVLATALLFGAMDPQIGEDMMPAAMKERITSAYLPTHPEIAQPVVRVPLTIYRIQDTLMIDEMVIQRGGDNGAPAAPAAGGQVVTDQQHAQVLINVQALQQAVAQNHQQHSDAIASLREWAHNQFRLVNNNIRAHGGTIQGALARQDPQQQARRRRATDPQQQVQQEGTLPATLSPTPRTLAELWEEYQFGIGGRKPAKDWSSTERGNTRQGIKQKYYRRKMVWLTMEKLMATGMSRDAAINKIRQAYGWRCSVTQIINFIIANHQNGGHGHPNLVDLSPYLRTGGRRARADV
jgi:Transcriptional activator of glycolytic enzymes